MADAEEEAVDGEVVATLYVGAYVVNEVSGLLLLGAVETNGVGVEENVNVLLGLDAVLHDL